MTTSDIESIKTIRRDIIRSCYEGGGHIGGALSIVDVLYVLYSSYLKDNENDFILSKGHAVPAQYAILHFKGIISDEEYASYGHFGTALIHHPNFRVNGVLYSSGALGNGISVGVGMALANKRLRNKRNVYVLMGDGEINEGTAWEGFAYAGSHQINNLVGIIDHNGLQASDETANLLNTSRLIKGIGGLGWKIVTCDGHDIAAISNCLRLPHKQPLLVVLNTIKGKGVSFMENDVTWHHRHPTEEEYCTAMKELS